MRKILLAIDAVNPDLSALDFAAYLGRLTKSYVTGIFLENIAGEEKPVFKNKYGLRYVEWEVDVKSDEHKLKMELIEKNISRFKEGCINREVKFEIRRYGGIPEKELINESRFADVLIVDADTSFNKRFMGTPTAFVRESLAKAECAVIIAPESFNTINQILFTYDARPSSLFAIKHFTYLFPELHHINTSVLQINETGEWNEVELVKLKGWMETYYKDISFEAIKGRSGDELADHLFTRKNMILILGAYGRNALSRFFKHSQADLLILETSQPVFIAHL